MTDDEDDIPGWERATLRTRVFASQTRDDEPCLSFYSFQFPGSRGDNGFIRRTDVIDSSYTTWGSWDNLTRDKGLAQFETLNAGIPQSSLVAEDSPALRDRLTLLLSPPVLSDWKEAQEPFTRNAVEVLRPLRLGKNPAPSTQLRLRLKTGPAA